MKERENKGDVVSFRNFLSGELVPVVAFYLPPVNMKSNVYDIIFLGDLKSPRYNNISWLIGASCVGEMSLLSLRFALLIIGLRL